MIKVSFGNKKLPRSTMIFNIPARVTCPGRTAFCEGACYALKAERMYKAVLPARQGNFEETRKASFAFDMAALVRRHRHKVHQVRIHESGDFYSQAYLEKWYHVCQDNPGTAFYAYTKSFHLNYWGKPSNLVLIASFDKSTRDQDRERYRERKRFFSNTFSIVDRKAPASCVQDCTICSTCWTGKGHNITVNQH
jgi:hypothetical protein